MNQEKSSDVILKFGPAAPGMLAELKPKDGVLRTELSRLINALCPDFIVQPERQIEVIFSKLKAGEGSLTVIAKKLRQANLAYYIQDAGNEDWAPSVTLWRPGMPKPVEHAANSGGDIMLEAKDVVLALKDYPEAIATLEEKFELGGIGFIADAGISV